MAKKKAKKSSNTVEAMPSSLVKSVRIEKVSNGFVISTYTDKGEKAKIAKTKVEATKIAQKMLA